MDLHEIAGAGGTIDLSGHKLTIRQLAVGDIAALQAWVTEKLPTPFEVVSKALIDLQPLKEIDPECYEESRKDIIKTAHADAKRGGGPDPNEAMETIQGIDGLSYVLFLASRELHKDVTYEMIKEWMNKEDLGKIKKKLDQINKCWVEMVTTNPPESPAVPTPG